MSICLKEEEELSSVGHLGQREAGARGYKVKEVKVLILVDPDRVDHFSF